MITILIFSLDPSTALAAFDENVLESTPLESGCKICPLLDTAQQKRIDY